MSGRGGLSVWLYLGLAAIAAAAAWWLAFDGLKRPRKRVAEVEDVADSPEPSPTAKGWKPRSAAQQPVAGPPEPGCTPQDAELCIRGDVWWLDSCGTPHEKADECGAALCTEGVCQDADARCEGLGAGRCDADVAVGCAAGRYYARDCAQSGRRCAITEEGAGCVSPERPLCPLGTVSRCEDNTLVSCVSGQEQQLDCAAVGGRCLPTRGGKAFACLRTAPPPDDPDCGACGCPPDPAAEEVCNGRDDDGDGFVDENIECDPIDLVAIVVADASGNTDYTQADLDAELDVVNQTFAREDDYGLTFRWAEVRYLDAEHWQEIDDDELQQVLTGSGHLPVREAFYVPIVFTRTLLVDGVPRPGLATPPNGSCGGVRRTQGRQPLIGGVIIAKQRWPTTVAHELGHYLGLCHTHAPTADIVADLDPATDALCEEPCAWEADGICDTPPDSGPAVCTPDPACGVVCTDGAAPSVSNIMGYYPRCRDGFSEEQAKLMRAGAALRRGWFACAFGACGCVPGTPSCPEDMTCSPFDAVEGHTQWKCRLDGPSPPGAPCKTVDACDGGLCVQTASGAKVCARPCGDQTPGCTCAAVPGIDVPLCTNDLQPS